MNEGASDTMSDVCQKDSLGRAVTTDGGSQK